VIARTRGSILVELWTTSWINFSTVAPHVLPNPSHQEESESSLLLLSALFEPFVCLFELCKFCQKLYKCTGSLFIKGVLPHTTLTLLSPFLILLSFLYFQQSDMLWLSCCMCCTNCLMGTRLGSSGNYRCNTFVLQRHRYGILWACVMWHTL
jgi:hypothetical protein